MITYASSLKILPSKKSYVLEMHIIDAVQKWIETKVGEELQNSNFANGFKRTFENKHHIDVYSSYPNYPRLMLICYTHPDNNVINRQWATEIGINQPSPTRPIIATIVSSVHDKVAISSSPIRITKPKLVSLISDLCSVKADTVGSRITLLNKNNMDEFKHKIFSTRRKHCIVLTSAGRNGTPLIDAQYLQALLLGVAELHVIADQWTSRAYAEELGKHHSSWLGAIKIIFPKGKDENIKVKSLLPDEVASSKDIYERILSIAAGSSNQNIYDKHKITYAVKHGVYITSSIYVPIPVLVDGGEQEPMEANNSKNDDIRSDVLDVKTEVQLIRRSTEESIKELRDTVSVFEELLSEKEDEVQKLASKIEYLSQISANIRLQTQNIEPTSSVRTFKSLKEVATVVEAEMSDRIILNGARKELEDSPFEDTVKVYSAFNILYNEFYYMFNGNMSMKKVDKALKAAGLKYNAHMDERNEVYKIYKGRKADMNRHIKIGVNRESRYLFRLHFEWDSEEKKVVVHHAGRHLKTTKS
ncbi:hypothetical protein MBAV_004518 [Candidatus Magnetobacterium bavaricum]|uniref:Uncharacterized protein n=1 Tax=Candidatus Magnetobacterium bavaricum TaxID=29290 RepID=A0A0F3GMW6_9BACT|nr:hypothetical protein MBAV_004518 [Candidatus Magnetobacterium bavaricum]